MPTLPQKVVATALRVKIRHANHTAHWKSVVKVEVKTEQIARSTVTGMDGECWHLFMVLSQERDCCRHHCFIGNSFSLEERYTISEPEGEHVVRSEDTRKAQSGT